MVDTTKVKELNKRIEKIRTAKTKAEAQKEVLEDSLAKKLKSYATQYGVDLSASTFDQVKKLVDEEHRRISEEVEKEYKLKLLVVKAIDEDNYHEAYRLLGIEESEVESKSETVPANLEVAGEEGIEVSSDDTGDLEDFLSGLDAELPVQEVLDDTEVNDDISGEDGLAFEDEDDNSKSAQPVQSGLVFDDDEDELDEDFGFGSILSGGKFKV